MNKQGELNKQALTGGEKVALGALATTIAGALGYKYGPGVVKKGKELKQKAVGTVAETAAGMQTEVAKTDPKTGVTTYDLPTSKMDRLKELSIRARKGLRSAPGQYALATGGGALSGYLLAKIMGMRRRGTGLATLAGAGIGAGAMGYARNKADIDAYAKAKRQGLQGRLAAWKAERAAKAEAKAQAEPKAMRQRGAALEEAGKEVPPELRPPAGYNYVQDASGDYVLRKQQSAVNQPLRAYLESLTKQAGVLGSVKDTAAKGLQLAEDNPEISGGIAGGVLGGGAGLVYNLLARKKRKKLLRDILIGAAGGAGLGAAGGYGARQLTGGPVPPAPKARISRGIDEMSEEEFEDFKRKRGW